MGNLMFPMDRLRDILEFYADFSVNAPDELCTDLIFGYPAGGGPGFVMLALCYSGDHAAGAKAMAPLKTLGKPLRGEIKPTDYVVLQRSADSDAPRATASYLKGGFLTALNQKLIDTIVQGMQAHPDRSTLMIFQQAGGAINRIPIDATAFAHRYAEHNMMITVSWKPGSPRQPHVADIKRYWATLAPFTHGFYVNEVDDDNAELVNKNYQGNYTRLLKIKRRYDPENIFRLNANIRPENMG